MGERLERIPDLGLASADVARRIQELAQLHRLGQELRRARWIGPVEEIRESE